MRKQSIRLLAGLALGVMTVASLHADIWEDVEHGYASNGDVKVHYASVGEGPLVVMIHGFPDFWYTWRHQMAGLRENFKVVAIDQRALRFWRSICFGHARPGEYTSRD